MRELFPGVFEHRGFLESLPDVELMWAEPLAKHTTFGVGGPVACLARPRSVSGLRELIRGLGLRGVPHFILGGGSNVLALDSPRDTVAIQLVTVCTELTLMEHPAEEPGEARELYAGAGVPMGTFLRFCLRHGLGGAEFLAGIPGTVGGALVMNAGTRYGAIADIVAFLDTVDRKGDVHRIPREALPGTYRFMGVPRGHVVLGGMMSLRARSVSEVRENLRSAMNYRRKTQPHGKGSAGCIYKNPEKEAAGALIEKAGLKGFTVGGARVSDKHANWIINTGNATAQDILQVMEHVESSVRERFGIQLEREVRVLE